MKANKDAIRAGRKFLKATFVDGRIDGSRALSVIRRLAQEKPRGYLSIIGVYQRLVRIELEKRHAIIESAVALEEGMQGRLGDALRNKYGDDVSTDFELNEDLIGGMRVRLGSDVWDGSVRGRLGRLGDALSR